ncbi:asparagine synthase (glutamine-hydrolyzing) [Candidatus Coxiella mudrowiae]|uniref:asparagine synthase (glutamine-hydrolyzing) n=1 Tax=Candidatus Coxiella mudrowiae TaxID=2054173 RepID=UPI000C2901BC|nr:asparagine synthase (glutamine-hydrolyzing) [Candidatus Coxiella mudrowiae]
MCGIVGIISLNNVSLNSDLLIEKMKNALLHRGPDGEGTWYSSDRRVFLGHRRLSIIDLTNHAAQPMLSYDGRYVLTYNGEIYNYIELRKKCEKRKSIFNSNSDTEVILECFRHWGHNAFSLFIGMWSLALYDLIEKKIILSRDRFAIKPLYYGIVQDNLFFASEPKALRAAHSRFNEIDDVSVQLFIENAFLERKDWTFFKYIKRFPHAHYSIIDLNKPLRKLNFICYWAAPSKTIKKISLGDAALNLRHLIIQSIKLHMRSDVQIGSCLSGGIDSSTIVSVVSRLQKGKPLQTFTIYYPNHTHLNESHWAKRVVELSGAIAIYVEPTYESFQNELSKLISIQDEPFGSISIFAQYTIFKQISTSQIKVILDGQGPDEMLAGYLGYLPIYLNSLLNKGNYILYRQELRAAKKRMNISLEKKSFSNFVKYYLKTKYNNLLNPNLSINSKSEFFDEYECRLFQLNQPQGDFEEQLKDLVCDSNLPQLLRYEDRNSMAFSIESRVPFISKDIVEFCLSLPVSLRINKGYTKAVLREAIKGIVPEDIRLRVDKLGFPAPEVDWLKKTFQINISSPGSREWREIITSKWKQYVLNMI